MSRAAWVAAGLVALGLAAWALLTLGLPRLAESGLRTALRQRGLTPADFDSLEVGLGTTRLTGLRIGAVPDPDLTLRDLTVHYSPLPLLRGEIDRVEIDGLRLRGRWDAEGLSLGSLDALLTPGEGDAATLPTLALELRDLRADFETPRGPIALPASGELNLDWPRQVEGALRFEVEHEAGRGSGQIDLAGSEQGVEASLRLEADTPRLEASASLQLREFATTPELALRAEADLRDLSIPPDEGAAGSGIDLARARLEIEVSGTPERLGGTLSVEASGGIDQAGLKLTGGSLDAELALQRADGEDRVSLVRCAHIALDTLVMSGAGGLEAPFAGCLHPHPDTPLLLRASSDDDGDALGGGIRLPGSEIAVRIGAGEDAERVSGTLPRADLLFGLPRDDAPLHGSFALRGGDLRIDTQDVRATDITLDGEWADGRVQGEAPLRVARLHDERDAGRIADLSFAGGLRQEGAQLRLAGTLRDASGHFRAEAKAIHDLAKGAGHGSLQATTLTFGNGGADAVSLFPWLEEWVEEAEGELDLRGSARWAEGPLESEAVAVVRNMRVDSPLAEVEQLNAAVHLDDVLAFTTPPHQLVGMATVSLGLVLTEGLVDFQLLPGPVVELGSADWRLAGGHIHAAGSIDLGSERPELLLEVEDLDLQALLAVLEIEGLSGTGVLDGTIPVALLDDAPQIDQAKLVARSPGGIVRYRPAGQASDPSQPVGGIDLARTALENFHYHTLELTLDGDATGDLVLHLHLAGANPDLYDGYPVELNLNVTGAFAELVRGGMTVYRVPKVLEERMQAFGGLP